MPQDSFVAYLDHAMVMLPSDAYRDVLASGFLREDFARMKEKNGVSSVLGPFSSVGVAGQNTLVQFFDAGAPHKRDFSGGLVFAFEAPGYIDRANERLAERGVEVEYDLGRRPEPGQAEEDAPPPYTMLWIDPGEGCPVTLTFDEAYPEFFDRLGAPLGPAGELYRRHYLDAVLGARHEPHHAFGDITGVTLRLRPAHAEVAMTAMEALDFKAAPGPDGTTTMHGPDHAVHLQVDEGDELEGVVALEIALTRPDLPPATHTFGDSSTLTIQEDGTARWTFAPVCAVPAS